MSWAKERHKLSARNHRAAPPHTLRALVRLGGLRNVPFLPRHSPTWRCRTQATAEGGRIPQRVDASGRATLEVTKPPSHSCLKHDKPASDSPILLLQPFSHSMPVDPPASLNVPSHKSLLWEIQPHMPQRWVSKTLPNELITSTNICHPLLHLAEVTLGGSGPPTATVGSTLATLSGDGSGWVYAGRWAHGRPWGGRVSNWSHHCGSHH